MRKPAPPQVIFALVATFVSAALQAAPELDALPDPVRERIAERCLSVQFSAGREAYRNCVLQESEAAGSETDPLAELNFDERIVMARTCASSRNGGDASFAACVVDRLAEAEPAPPPRGMTAEEGRLARTGCLTENGADFTGYRACLRSTFAELDVLGRPALAELEPRELQTLLTTCGQHADGATDFRRCVNEATGATVGGADATNTAAEQTSEDQIVARTDNGATGSQAAEPSDAGSDGTAAAPDDAPSPNDGRSEEAAAANAGETAGDIGGMVAGVLASLETQGRALLDRTEGVVDGLSRSTGLPPLAVYAAAGFPLLMLVMVAALVRRHRRRHPRFAPSHDFDLERDDDALYDAIDELDLGRRDRDDDDSSMRFGGSDDDEHPLDRPVERDRDELPHHPHVDEHAVTRFAPGPWLTDDNDETDHRDLDAFDTNETGTGTFDYDSSPVGRSEFSAWLEEQSDEARFSHAMEFLIYWIAYGDGRYPASLRERLFASDELGSRDRIKRWVLQEDVEAFSDAVQWLDRHSTELQRTQLIDLLMALLVRERGITPVQITVLRLLADRFGIGAAGIEATFEEAFGESLPPLPRPDRVDWWERQAAEAVASWSPAHGARLDELGRARSLLGLAEGDREIEVIRAYRRAVKRCHPDRFTTLGPRARALAIRQFDHFEEARDRLLGIAV